VSRVRKILAVSVLTLAALTISTSGVSASSSAIVIPFEKHAVGPGHYVGTAGDGGTIEMQVYDSASRAEIPKRRTIGSSTSRRPST
jgi:hypothetical protein